MGVVTAVILIIIERFILYNKMKNTEERSQRLRDANKLLYNKKFKI